MLRNTGGTRAVDASPPITAATATRQQDDWGDEDIAPGESYTRTFSTSGDYPYFLAAYPDLTGAVIVQEEAQPDFSLAVTPGSRMVTQGQSVTYTVALTATDGFTASVMLSISGLPSGAAPTWSANPITPSGSTVLTVTTATGTPTGDHIFTGTGGGESHDAQATLTVEASTTPDFLLDAWPATQTITRGHSVNYTVAVTAVNGFTQAVMLDVGSTPTSATVAWATNPLTPTTDTTLTITPSASGPTGTFTLVITGTSNPVHTTQVELVVVAEPAPPTPDFALDVTPETRSVRQSRSVTTTVVLTALHGFTVPVALSVGDLPAGVTADWATNPVTPDGSTALTTPLGDHRLVITGTGGGSTHVTPFTLTVLPHPDFAFAVMPPTRTITQGLAVTFTAYLTAENDWEGPVQLSVQGLPTGAVAGWVTNPVIPSGSSLLVLTTAATTPAGIYPLMAVADGGLLSHTAPFTLTVLPHPDFALSVVPTTHTITQGMSVTYTVHLTSEHGFGDWVTLAVGGVPTDTAVSWGINPVVPTGRTVLTLTTTTTTPVGVHPLTVTGTGGGFTHTSDITLTVLALLPDLIVENVQVSPALPVEGQEAAITVTIRNQSVMATGPFQVDWYVNPVSPPGVGDSGVVSWTVASLGPHASTALTTTHIFTPDGEYGLWAQADTLDVVAEASETNNVTGPMTATVLSAVQEVCGTISEDTIWYSGVVYVVTCDVTVQSGVTLTVEPGVTVRVFSGEYLRFDGTLLAEGTEIEPILFTPHIPGQYWAGLNFYDGSDASVLDHMVVEYADDNGLYLYKADITIRNSTIRHNIGNGIYMHEGSAPVLTGNAITSNGGYAVYVTTADRPVINVTNTASGNDRDVQYVYGDHYTTDCTWNNWGVPYVFHGIYYGHELHVQGGVTLTIEAGVTVRASSGDWIKVLGTLVADGTAIGPITFMPDNGIAGGWHGLVFYDGSDASVLDHVMVEYTDADGLYLSKADIIIRNSTIRHNVGNGIHVVSALPAISGNNIYENGNCGVYNATSSNTVIAEHNWWGSDSGPAPYGSGNGINYTTSCIGDVCTIIPYVDVIPWLGQQTYYGQSVPNVAYEADPVNTANGNYAYQRTDLSISTRGLPLEFTRAYNSLAPEDGPLGYGWSHTWMVTAEENGDDVRITYGDGRQIHFTWDGSEYVPAAGVFSTLTKTVGVFHLTEKNQTVYHFDAQDRLASVEDNNSNTTTLAYDPQGRLTTVTEPAGHTLTFAYTSPLSDSLLSSVADSLTRSIRFTYNITGELTVVTDTRGYTTTYTYDADHRLLSITDANGHTFVTNEYNSAGRVSKQWDAQGNLTTFDYDEPDRETIVTDLLGGTTTYQYDSLLRLTSETDDPNQTQPDCILCLRRRQ